MIQALDKASVRLLSSGQVISTVSSVVKELLENAIDAQASTVDIYMTDFGLGSITVSDDGAGIPVAAAPPDEEATSAEGQEGEGRRCFLLAARASSKCPQMLLAPASGGLVQASSSVASSAVEGGSCDTLGFRGEALHSLAHTSILTIHTRRAAEDGEYLRILTYGAAANKTIVSRAPLATTVGSSWLAGRDSGTIVTVKELFSMLPVRRREVGKNAKKQFAQAVALVKQYALTNPKVRLLLRHQEKTEADDKDGDSAAVVTHVATSGSGDLQRSLGDAYGSRILGSMAQVEWQLERCVVRGYVSKVGQGRATSDVQVIALNGRLVDMPRVCKAIADAFVQCHPSAAQRVSPAFFLLIEPILSPPADEQNEKRDEPEMVAIDVDEFNAKSPGTGGEAASAQRMHFDINITPDKRQVLVQGEEQLIREVFSAAKRTFSTSSEFSQLPQQPSNKPQQPSSLMMLPSQRSFHQTQQQQFATQQSSVPSFTPVIMRSQTTTTAAATSSGVMETTPLRRADANPFAASGSERKFFPLLQKPTTSTEENESVRSLSMGEAASPPGSASQHKKEAKAFPSPSPSLVMVGEEVAPSNAEPILLPDPTQPAALVMESCTCCDTSSSRALKFDLSQQDLLPQSGSAASPSTSQAAYSGCFHQQYDHAELVIDDGEMAVPSQFKPCNKLTPFMSLEMMAIMPPLDADEGEEEDQVDTDDDDDDDDDDNAPSRKRSRTEKKQHAEKKNKAHTKKTKKKVQRKNAKPLAQQSDKDLDECLNKAAFRTMTIYGQFNHGFIIASHEDLLFVIDQHAADEKYNYEQLVMKYKARPQPLVRPFQLSMDPHECEVALDNAEQLAQHGFMISRATEQGESTGISAMLVRSVPVLAYDTVTPQDVLELTQQLLQYGSVVKPLRAVWHSLATKACRTSIMIGTALDRRAMTGIVRHMAEMTQPWNCPHGRPTLRHVGYLSQF